METKHFQNCFKKSEITEEEEEKAKEQFTMATESGTVF